MLNKSETELQKGQVTDWKQLPLVLEAKHLVIAMGIGTNAAYDLMHREGFPSVRIGNRFYVGREALKVWLIKQSYEKERS